MTRAQRLAAGAAAIALAAGVSAGGASAATICFSFVDLETEFWVAGHQAIITTLTDAGHTVIERNANEDANRQLEQVRDCIAQGVDGIILIPQDGETATTIVAEAQDADTPIAVFNRPPSDLSKGIVVVADNATIAQPAVEFIVETGARRRAARRAKSTPSSSSATLATRTPSAARTASTPRSTSTRTASTSPRSPRNGTQPRLWATSRRPSPPTRRSTCCSPRRTSCVPTIRSVFEPRGMWKKHG